MGIMVAKEIDDLHLICPSIIIFIICILFFDNGGLSIFITLSFLALLIFCEKLFIKKVPIEKILTFRKWLLISFIILFILDIITTFLDTQYYKAGYETNKLLIFLWGIFGYYVGELIDLIFMFVIINLLFIYSKHKNYYVSLCFIILIFIITIGFFLAVFNNILILFHFPNL